MPATQRTRRIRLGPLVYLLPLYDPLRLIEEVSMLDQLSGGRLELGIGRGVSPYELRNFGVDPADSRAIFDEALSVLLAGLTQPRLNDLVRGKIVKFSLDALVNMLGHAGMRVEMKVKRAA